ncbi:MAG: MotA/TolQ/ExbB proton channel family protein [Bdellovibrionales bacterium]
MSTGLILLSWVEYGILGLMLGLSIWSVAIMIERRQFFLSQKSSEGSEKIREMVLKHEWNGLLQSTGQKNTLLDSSLHLLVSLFQKGEFQSSASMVESLDRAYRSHINSQKIKMEKGLANLATLGANAPFIGLFGTVLGIIQAFAALGFESTGTGTVMSGISRSLIATATGLFVAIPAVIAFNYFSKRLKEIYAETDSLKDLFISRILTKSESNSGRGTTK